MSRLPPPSIYGPVWLLNRLARTPCGWSGSDPNPEQAELTVLGDIERWAVTYLETGLCAADYACRLGLARRERDQEARWQRPSDPLPRSPRVYEEEPCPSADEVSPPIAC